MIVTSPMQFLLVEPIAKTPYPPLGLMKISTWLKRRNRGCTVASTIGTVVPPNITHPKTIFITSLFTWQLDKVVKVVHFYADHFPSAHIRIGGIAASLVPDFVESKTGIRPHVGLIRGAEDCSPDYSMTFGRFLDASITFASRGCPRDCRFCSVSIHEPLFEVRDHWEKDVNPDLPRIILWDNNWLASPRFADDCGKLRRIGKVVDFNQGLDARLYDKAVARELATIRLSPIRFAFDNIAVERALLKAISLAKGHSAGEIRVYVLYNFDDTPEDLYYRLELLNRNGILAFPMEYRQPTPNIVKLPGRHWSSPLLRAMKLTLLYYYRRGMITDSRRAFHSIYGTSASEFVDRLHNIYEYDKKLKK